MLAYRMGNKILGETGGQARNDRPRNSNLTQHLVCAPLRPERRVETRTGYKPPKFDVRLNI